MMKEAKKQTTRSILGLYVFGSRHFAVLFTPVMLFCNRRNFGKIFPHIWENHWSLRISCCFVLNYREWRNDWRKLDVINGNLIRSVPVNIRSEVNTPLSKSVELLIKQMLIKVESFLKINILLYWTLLVILKSNYLKYIKAPETAMKVASLLRVQRFYSSFGRFD